MAKKKQLESQESEDLATISQDSENVGSLQQTKTVSNVENSVVSVENLIGLKVTQIEFGVGAHLMGQHLTLSASRGSQLQIADKGILAHSKSGRVCLLPWANIKAVEIVPAKINLRTGRLK